LNLSLLLCLLLRLPLLLLQAGCLPSWLRGPNRSLPLLRKPLRQRCLNECRLRCRQPRWQLLLPSSAGKHRGDGCGICQHAPHPHCRRRCLAAGPCCCICCLDATGSWLCGAAAGSSGASPGQGKEAHQLNILCQLHSPRA
jgi:hypothetical protein